MKKKAYETLEEMAITNKERNALYGDNFELVGAIMESFFPNGLKLETAEQYNRFHFWFMTLVKMTRLAVTDFNHQDSAHDIGVYAAMLETLIHNSNASKEHNAFNLQIDDPQELRAHQLYKRFDEDAPSQIKDINGQVCLALCKICGLAECELLQTPNCPGEANHD